MDSVFLRLLDHGVDGVRTYLQQIFGYGFAESHASCAAFKEVFRQWCVEEVRFVRNHVVQDRDDFAVPLHFSGYVSERRCEVRHPVSDYQHIRFPVADRLVCAVVSKRIGRIQQGCALHRYGLIVSCHKLCLSREEEFWILSLEVECLDNMIFAQFLM